MKKRFDYLEAGKIKELASQLEGEGYEVVTSPSESDAAYDLVASKKGKKIAYEVKVRSKLPESVEEIRRLREQAMASGYDEFRLVVVSPPREVTVKIDQLEEELLHHLQDNLPEDLSQLSAPVKAVRVSQVDVDVVEVSRAGIHAIGDGVIDVEVIPVSGDGHNRSSWITDFPFSFDVRLDQGLRIAEVYRLAVDTAGFDD